MDDDVDDDDNHLDDDDDDRPHGGANGSSRAGSGPGPWHSSLRAARAERRRNSKYLMNGSFDKRQEAEKFKMSDKYPLTK